MTRATITLDTLRRYAIARSMFTPTTLDMALNKLQFVQADPLRAPARAQDLTLRHRVVDYRVGDLQAAYPKLQIEEDFFINYGFISRPLHHLMHPRTPRQIWDATRMEQAQEVLAFIKERGVVRPADVDAVFKHGRVRNWFGGTSRTSSQILDGMHYRGLLRVAGRAGGHRLYALRDAEPTDWSPDVILDTLVDVIVAKYAPVPASGLTQLISLLWGGVPQWRDQRVQVLQRAKARLRCAVVDGLTWYWPHDENPKAQKYAAENVADDKVRLLAPFDPVVWDRRRFELLWNWAYRFEAYTPAAKRVRGYYALPLLWHDQVIGWGNISVQEGVLTPDIGYIANAPKGKAYKAALDDELHCMAVFLSLK